MFKTLTEKQKDAPQPGASFCLPDKILKMAGSIQKVHVSAPKKFSRQRGSFSKMVKKQKLCKIQRQIDMPWFCDGMVPLALTKTKKLFEKFLKILEIKNSCTKMI